MNDTYLRLSCFLLILMVMMVAEYLRPRRRLSQPRGWRWGSNLTLSLLNSVVLKWVFPIAATGAAVWADQNRVGLFHSSAIAPSPMVQTSLMALGLIALDFTLWLQHLMFHKVPILWRLHRMHHSDLDIDTTTALRFHPLEMVLSMMIKMGVVVLLGISPVTVMLFEIVLNGMALFNHSNLNLPLWLEQPLRRWLVTPDMHRVHHSCRQEETDSNFGFNLSLWDRLFKTYRAEPLDGQLGMTIGLQEFRSPKSQTLLQLLMQPWR